MTKYSKKLSQRPKKKRTRKKRKKEKQKGWLFSFQEKKCNSKLKGFKKTKGKFFKNRRQIHQENIMVKILMYCPTYWRHIRVNCLKYKNFTFPKVLGTTSTHSFSQKLTKQTKIRDSIEKLRVQLPNSPSMLLYVF